MIGLLLLIAGIEPNPGPVSDEIGNESSTWPSFLMFIFTVVACIVALYFILETWEVKEKQTNKEHTATQSVTNETIQDAMSEPLTEKSLLSHTNQELDTGSDYLNEENILEKTQDITVQGSPKPLPFTTLISEGQPEVRTIESKVLFNASNTEEKSKEIEIENIQTQSVSAETIKDDISKPKSENILSSQTNQESKSTSDYIAEKVVEEEKQDITVQGSPRPLPFTTLISEGQPEVPTLESKVLFNASNTEGKSKEIETEKTQTQSVSAETIKDDISKPKSENILLSHTNQESKSTSDYIAEKVVEEEKQDITVQGSPKPLPFISLISEGQPEVRAIESKVLFNASNTEGKSKEIEIEKTQTQSVSAETIKDDISKPQSENLLLSHTNQESKSTSDYIAEKVVEEEKQDMIVQGSPNITAILSDSVSLTWHGLANFDKDTSHYQVRFKDVGQKRWTIYTEVSDIGRITVQGLKSKCTYVFQVRAVVNDEECKYSLTSDEVTTRTSFAAYLLPFTTLIKEGQPEIRAIPSTELYNARNKEGKSRKLEIGCKRRIKDEKTILLIGATGTGKSTLVDGIINYVAGVNWNDTFRFKLVSLEREEEQNIHNQAISQTEWITTYVIHPEQGSRLQYTLNIIDTPGFGDTRGLDRDRLIVNQLRQLFCDTSQRGIVTIDAVCFIVKAPDARLTHSQKYVFMQILSLFGKDIEENIMYLITFADGETPPVLAAMKEAQLPDKRHFVFNNSGLFATNTARNSGLSPFFWKLGTNSFEQFFKELESMPKKSLSLTKEVLIERERMTVTIRNLQIQIDAGLCKLSDLENDLAQLEKYKKQITDNAEYEFECTETKQLATDLKNREHVTNCLPCNRTCHYPCFIQGDVKQSCAAMNSLGNCNQCSERCSWKVHSNGRTRFTYIQVKVKKTLKEMEKAYKAAGDNKLSYEEIIIWHRIEIDNIFDIVLSMMKEVNVAINRLKVIALRPDPLTIVGHIELMIQSEKDEGKSGYLDRIHILQKYLKEANFKKEVSKFQERYEHTAIHTSIPTAIRKRVAKFFNFRQ